LGRNLSARLRLEYPGNEDCTEAGLRRRRHRWTAFFQPTELEPAVLEGPSHLDPPLLGAEATILHGVRSELVQRHRQRRGGLAAQPDRWSCRIDAVCRRADKRSDAVADQAGDVAGQILVCERLGMDADDRADPAFEG